MTFIEMLTARWQSHNSLLCVGIDPDMTRMPHCLAQKKNVFFHFARAIVDATADVVCAYKLQNAYYTALGRESEAEAIIAYIHARYPGIPVILDAKRGDIGSTAAQYAKEAFTRYEADAITVNPYMGSDSLEPFLAWQDKGVIVLCRTSNQGAVDIQDLIVGGKKLYQHIAQLATERWNRHGNVLLVVGATCPEELGEVRAMVGNMPLLVPGIGAQGGDVRATVSKGKDAKGTGMLINSSRAIIYASSGDDFAEAARQAALDLRDEINRYR